MSYCEVNLRCLFFQHQEEKNWWNNFHKQVEITGIQEITGRSVWKRIWEMIPVFSWRSRLKSWEISSRINALVEVKSMFLGFKCG